MFGMDDELRRGLHALYRQVLAAWNAADAAAWALFREDGEVIGFDEKPHGWPARHPR